MVVCGVEGKSCAQWRCRAVCEMAGTGKCRAHRSLDRAPASRSPHWSAVFTFCRLNLTGFLPTFNIQFNFYHVPL